MINLKNITKNYGEKNVYSNFNLDIEENKTLVVLGESGSGKTTLLNVIAGLTDFSGEVSGVEKPVSFVFQRDRLIPNLTVEQNLRLICRNTEIDKPLKAVGLLDAKNLYPKQLSAGMARRIALLRAYLYPSKSLLMDEPFINLDVALKFALMDMLKTMQKENPKTAVIVTHDIKEAVTVADRIVVLSKGKIVFDTSTINEKTEELLLGLLIKNSMLN